MIVDCSTIPMMSIATLTIAAFLIPLLYLATRSRWLVRAVGILATCCVAYLNVELVLHLYRSEEIVVYTFGGWPPPIGIVFEVDLFSAILALFVSLIMALITIYSAGHIEDDRVHLYYSLLMIAEVGMLGVVYTGDIFNMFVLIEVLSVSCYALIAYERSGRALSASMKYGIYGALATTIFLLGIAYCYGALGTLNLADIASKILGLYFPVSRIFGKVEPALFVLVAAVFWMSTFKAAVFPNHFWLPDAHSEAPSPVSAMLSGVVVTVGLYIMIRLLLSVLSACEAVSLAMMLLMVFALVSSFIGSIAMIVERDVKRLIAYSTILNMGLIALCISTRTVFGLAVALSYIVNHGVAKALAFLSIGFAVKNVGTRDIELLKGVGRRFKCIGIPLSISLLCLGGVPPLALFFSKLYMYVALWNTYGPIITCIAIAPSVLGFIGYARLLYEITIAPPTQSIDRIRVTPFEMLTVILLSVACIALGFLTPYLVDTLFTKASEQLLDIRRYIEAARSYAEALIGTVSP